MCITICRKSYLKKKKGLQQMYCLLKLLPTAVGNILYTLCIFITIAPGIFKQSRGVEMFKGHVKHFIWF